MKKLKINGNKLRTLPPELSGCRSLEIVNASENVIQSIPAELSTLPALSSLSLANNRLTAIPYALADCNTLVDIDMSNNPDLDMIPDEIKTNAKMILWVCDKWRCERGRFSLGSGEGVAPSFLQLLLCLFGSAKRSGPYEMLSRCRPCCCSRC